MYWRPKNLPNHTASASPTARNAACRAACPWNYFFRMKAQPHPLQLLQKLCAVPNPMHIAAAHSLACCLGSATSPKFSASAASNTWRCLQDKQQGRPAQMSHHLCYQEGRHKPGDSAWQSCSWACALTRRHDDADGA